MNYPELYSHVNFNNKKRVNQYDPYQLLEGVSGRLHWLLYYELPRVVQSHKFQQQNKRAQRALGRSPEEKVTGNSVANNREPQGHNLNNFGRGPFDDVIY